MVIEQSDIVRQLNGRDAGCLFIVVSTDGQYGCLCDGKGRKLGHPKRKKLKHLQYLTKSDSATAVQLREGLTVQDSQLRRLLAGVRTEYQKFNYEENGGM